MGKAELTLFGEASPRSKTCCFTGHRPEKLTVPEEDVRVGLREEILRAIDEGYTIFITGMARGVDLIAAEVVLDQKVIHPELMLFCAIPYLDMEKVWGLPWRVRYERVRAAADESLLFADHYIPFSYHKRNRWMVDHASLVIAVYMQEDGGTQSTMSYARRQGVKIRQVQL